MKKVKKTNEKTFISITQETLNEINVAQERSRAIANINYKNYENVLNDFNAYKDRSIEIKNDKLLKVYKYIKDNFIEKKNKKLVMEFGYFRYGPNHFYPIAERVKYIKGMIYFLVTGKQPLSF